MKRFFDLVYCRRDNPKQQMKNENTILKDHCIYLNGGRLAERNNYDDVSRILENFIKSRKEHLLVYFHGGLVNKKNAEEQVSNTLFHTFNKPSIYPIFFIWETGIQETVKNNLSDGTLFSLIKSDFEDLFNNRLARIIKEKLSQYVVSKLKEEEGLKGLKLKLESREDIHNTIEKYETSLNEEDSPKIKEPFVDVFIPEEVTLVSKLQENQLEKDLKQDLGVANSIKQIIRSTESEEGIKNTTVFGDNYFDEFEKEIRKEIKENEGTRGILSTKALLKLSMKAIKVFSRVISRFKNGTDHGVYPTVIEEMFREFYVGYAGTKIWQMIKGDAEKAFGKEEESINPYLYGGLSFVELLKEKIQHLDYNPSVNFVGHSAGSVFIYHMLSSISNKSFSENFKVNLLLMAPACTSDLFSTLVERYWSRVNNFRVYNLYDEYEITDKMLGYLYPRSILYFVSGLLEENVSEPILGMERYYQNDFRKIRNLNLKPKIKLFYSQNRDSFVWLPNITEKGEIQGPITHGGFDDTFMLNILISDIINFTQEWRPTILQSL